MHSVRNLSIFAALCFSCVGFCQTTTNVTTSSSSAAINQVQPQNVGVGGLTVTTSMSTMSQPRLAGGNVPVRPQVTFPPTPPPRPPVTPMTQEQVDEHILPRNILSQTSDVVAISYNGFRRSQLDPCGCVSHQLGGLDKEASVIKRLEDLKIPVTVVDAGGYVRDQPTDTDIGRSKLLLKALHTLGANVVNVGYSDLSGGVDKLKGIAKAADVEAISANVTDASGKLLFPPYSVQTVKTPAGDVKIGYVGVTRPRIPVIHKKATSGTQEAASSTPAGGNTEGYTITDAIDALEKYVPEARQKADLVVALVYDRRDKTAEMLKELGDKAKLDVAISGEYLQPQANVLDINGTKLVSAGFEGRQTGLLVVSVKDKKIAAASNQFIEIVQSLPSLPEITKFVTEAKSLTVAPAGTPAIGGAAPAQLDLGKDESEKRPAGKTSSDKSSAEKPKPAKLDLGKE